MTRVEFDEDEGCLRAKREALLEQLAAVDRALAALVAPETPVANAQDLKAAEPAVDPAEGPAEEAGPVVPRRVTARRTLTDEHRHAITEGRRKARHAKDAAAGRAREAIDPAPGLAPASTATEFPRLVKRQS